MGVAEPRREVACLLVDAGACALGEAAGEQVPQHFLQLCASAMMYDACDVPLAASAAALAPESSEFCGHGGKRIVLASSCKPFRGVLFVLLCDLHQSDARRSRAAAHNTASQQWLPLQSSCAR